MTTAGGVPRDLAPFIKRADEIGPHHPLMSYYCRLYAAELAMEMKTPQAQKALLSLLPKLEAAKPKVGVSKDPTVDLAACKAFALQVYGRADRADRAGKADEKQVDAFSAASTFLKTLKHFGELDEDTANRQQYAEWRAWDLAQALQTGRKPSDVHNGTDDAGRTAASNGAFGTTAPANNVAAPAPLSPAPAPVPPAPVGAAPSFSTASPLSASLFGAGAPNVAYMVSPASAAGASPAGPASQVGALDASTPTTSSAPLYPSLDSLNSLADNLPSMPLTPSQGAFPPGASPSVPPELPLVPPQAGGAPLPPHVEPPSPPSAPPPPPPGTPGPAGGGGRWTPQWGTGGPFEKGVKVLYEDKAAGGSVKVATVVDVDLGTDPVAYTIEVDGVERGTEASRLAPTPKPPGAAVKPPAASDIQQKGAQSGVVDRNEAQDLDLPSAPSATPSQPPPPPGPPPSLQPEKGGEREAEPSAQALAIAREHAVAAAKSLDPSAGTDVTVARESLRLALEQLGPG